LSLLAQHLALFSSLLLVFKSPLKHRLFPILNFHGKYEIKQRQFLMTLQTTIYFLIVYAHYYFIAFHCTVLFLLFSSLYQQHKSSSNSYYHSMEMFSFAIMFAQHLNSMCIGLYLLYWLSMHSWFSMLCCTNNTRKYIYPESSLPSFFFSCILLVWLHQQHQQQFETNKIPLKVLSAKTYETKRNRHNIPNKQKRKKKRVVIGQVHLKRKT